THAEASGVEPERKPDQSGAGTADPRQVRRSVVSPGNPVIAAASATTPADGRVRNSPKPPRSTPRGTKFSDPILLLAIPICEPSRPRRYNVNPKRGLTCRSSGVSSVRLPNVCSICGLYDGAPVHPF